MGIQMKMGSQYLKDSIERLKKKKDSLKVCKCSKNKQKLINVLFSLIYQPKKSIKACYQLKNLKTLKMTLLSLVYIKSMN